MPKPLDMWNWGSEKRASSIAQDAKRHSHVMLMQYRFDKILSAEKKRLRIVCHFGQELLLENGQ
jgi:hypothetical protein